MRLFPRTICCTAILVSCRSFLSEADSKSSEGNDAGIQADSEASTNETSTGDSGYCLSITGAKSCLDFDSPNHGGGTSHVSGTDWAPIASTAGTFGKARGATGDALFLDVAPSATAIVNGPYIQFTSVGNSPVDLTFDATLDRADDIEGPTGDHFAHILQIGFGGSGRLLAVRANFGAETVAGTAYQDFAPQVSGWAVGVTHKVRLSVSPASADGGGGARFSLWRDGSVVHSDRIVNEVVGYTKIIVSLGTVHSHAMSIRMRIDNVVVR